MSEYQDVETKSRTAVWLREHRTGICLCSILLLPVLLRLAFLYADWRLRRRFAGRGGGASSLLREIPEPGCKW